MNRLACTGICVAAMVVAATTIAAGPQLADSVTPDRIQEAIQLASDDAAGRRFLAAYIVQSRAGWGNGPLLGVFSTPYARIVQAARAARAQKNTFTASDVTPDLLVPEVHVIIVSDQPATDDTARATARAVFIAPRGSKTTSERIAPLRTSALTNEYRERYGVSVAGTAIVAVFPLSAVSATNELVVVFDRTARGSSAISSCRDCTVAFDMARLR